MVASIADVAAGLSILESVVQSQLKASLLTGFHLISLLLGQVKGCCTGSIGNRSGNSLNDICIMSTSSEPYRSSGKRSESVKNEFLLQIHRSHPPCCLNRSNCIGQLQETGLVKVNGPVQALAHNGRLAQQISSLVQECFLFCDLLVHEFHQNSKQK